MKNILRKARSYIFKPKPSQNRFNFVDIGFHGDEYLLNLVDTLLKKSNFFVETGTNVGSTLAYVARNYPSISCLSCEPDINAYQQALANVSNYSNVSLFNETSQKFLKQILNQESIINGEVIFWLDAHGYGFEWPLKEEIELITKAKNNAFILIDDFLVPELDCFGYDKHEGQVCSFEFIKDSLNACHNYSLYYPKYTDKTSKHHPLRGWGLIEYGHDQRIIFPKSLEDKIKNENL